MFEKTEKRIVVSHLNKVGLFNSIDSRSVAWVPFSHAQLAVYPLDEQPLIEKGRVKFGLMEKLKSDSDFPQETEVFYMPTPPQSIDTLIANLKTAEEIIAHLITVSGTRRLLDLQQNLESVLGMSSVIWPDEIMLFK